MLEGRPYVAGSRRRVQLLFRVAGAHGGILALPGRISGLLRLRPDGESGLTVSQFTGFRDYQLRQAWVWEHQALSRARFVAGDAAIDAHLAQAAKTPTELSLMHLYPIDGAVQRVAADATAWGARNAQFSMVIAAIDEDVHDLVDEDDAPFSAE